MTISIIWSTEDVQQIRPDLNEEDAYEVLLSAYESHDCNRGFTWDYLESWAERIFPENGESE